MHPETYFLPPTPYVPNSPLPALIYRGVLSNPTPSSVRAAIEANHWLQGGSFKTYTAHHFHSVTHECYAVFKGKTRLRLGKGPLDDENVPNVEVDLFTGDVIILPAGVGHSSISNDSSEGEYEYLGLYPEGSPHWDNNFCKADPEETKSKDENARKVPIPQFDPIYGEKGPLCEIWAQAAQ